MKEVSELSAVKFENFIFKLQAAQTQYQALDSAVRAHLEAMRVEAEAEPTDVYDPNTRSFKASV